MESAFDTIIVGAGTAGSVLARRLVDAGQRVLLLEAGGADTNPAIHDPMRMGELWHGQEDWDYYTVPQTHANNRELHLPRGKVLGGSHSLNAMIHVRCAPQDFDHWASLGNPGWAWNDVLPIYIAMEKWSGGASALRGDTGLLDVVLNEPLHPIQQSIIDAAVETGLEYNEDYNGDHLDGISQEQVTMRDGKRLNTWLAYAAPVADSPNFTVTTGAWVHRLLITGTRATGVEFEVDGEVRQASADMVVLTAGALDSPRILLRSGIGPADELRELGIEVVVDVPGVGRNLHDHFLVPVIFATETREIEPPTPGRSVTQTHLFWRSRAELEVPDTQPINFSVPMYQPGMTGPESAFTLMAGIISTESRGQVRLSGAGAHDPLLIDPNVFACEADLASMEASVLQCREIGRASALADGWGAREIYPGHDIDDGPALRDYVRERVATYHHPVGTCAMGNDDMAVVDHRLMVHGVDGLMVADASIMPKVTTGNTNAPTMVIAEKAAGFLLAYRSEQRRLLGD